jgi:hypothetical protein
MKHIPTYNKFTLNEATNTNDYMARYGKTNILIKKGYKVANENELEDLYTKLGEIIKEIGFEIKNITVTL